MKLYLVTIEDDGTPVVTNALLSKPATLAEIHTLGTTLLSVTPKAISTDAPPANTTELPVEPQYDHHCPECVFLGQFEFQGVHYDLYCCRLKLAQAKPMLMARFGSEVTEVIMDDQSTPTAAEVLMEARRRAKALTVI